MAKRNIMLVSIGIGRTESGVYRKVNEGIRQMDKKKTHHS